MEWEKCPLPRLNGLLLWSIFWVYFIWISFPFLLLKLWNFFLGSSLWEASGILGDKTHDRGGVPTKTKGPRNDLQQFINITVRRVPTSLGVLLLSWAPSKQVSDVTVKLHLSPDFAVSVCLAASVLWWVKQELIFILISFFCWSDEDNVFQAFYILAIKLEVQGLFLCKCLNQYNSEWDRWLVLSDVLYQLL